MSAKPVPKEQNAAAKSQQKNVSGEAGFSPFLSLSADLMAITDEEGFLTCTNPAFQTVLGYAENEMRSIKLPDLLHPDDRAGALEAIRGVIENNVDTQGAAKKPAPVCLEARAIAASGGAIPMDWRFMLEGKNLYCMARDIRAVKAQQKSLAAHEAQLSEAESIGKIGRWRWRVGQQDFDWSPELYRIFDTSPENFEPTLESVTRRIHRADADRMFQAFQRAMIAQTPYDIDFRIIKNDGETAYIRCRGRCAVNEFGEVTALYGIMQDMTQIMLHEEELRRAKETAERAYAAKTQFLANMSHELRTPLNAIIGFSEMMQRQLLGPIGTKKYLDYIAGIRESGEHLLDLITDILDMSKIEAGKYTLHLEEINIAKLIRMALHMMEGRALEAGIKFVTELGNEELVIKADRRAMLQMVLNILSNAVKFSHQSGTVYISCHERENYYSIKIRDEGIGIPAHKLQDVLSPFEQAQSHYAREYEGTGLGLAITKELAELHGGGLYIESTLGQGTTVTIRMPYEAQPRK